jgi:uncharacterized Rmd1/YagE family protein
MITVRARSIGDRVRTRPPGERGSLSPEMLLLEGREGGRLMVFRFGAAVSFDLSVDDEARLITQVMARVENPHDDVAGSDEAAVVVVRDENETVQPDGTIRIREASPERLEILGNVLAKSAALAYHELRVAEVFDQMEHMAREFRDVRMPGLHRQVQRRLGDALLTQIQTIGRVEVLEKPDLTWDDPDLDRLYERLAAEFELRERDQALTRKLDLITTVSSTYLDLVADRRTLRVEWYIVILIVVEIVIILYELFVH